MMDLVEKAIYETVHGYRAGANRGAVALAPRVGMRAGTLSNKADPAMESHQLTLRESIPIQQIAQNFSILYAYAAVLDHCAVELGDFNQTSDVEMLDLYCEYHARIGTGAQALRNALQDRRITFIEARNVKCALLEQIRAGMELQARVEALAGE